VFNEEAEEEAEGVLGEEGESEGVSGEADSISYQTIQQIMKIVW